MKRMAFKVLALLICAIMLFTGCQSAKPAEKAATTAEATTAATAEATTAAPAEDQSGVSAPGTFPIVKDKLTFKTYFSDNTSWCDYSANNRALQDYEKKTNIHLDLVFGDPKVMIASGDYPEMFFSAGFSNQDIIDYSSQGILLPLNELIDKYASFLKQAKEEYYPHMFEDLSAPDGKIYGISTSGSGYAAQTQKAYINVAWLKEAGLQMPKTTDEFEAVLKAFKARGSKVVPYTGAIGTWWGDCQYFLINPFILTDFDNSFIYVDGSKKLQMAAIQPEFREGLKWANKLYKEGLIDPGAFTQKLEQMQLLFTDNGKTNVGVWTGGHLRMMCASGVNLELEKMYEALPPLTGPNGKGYTCWWDNTRLSGASWAITNKCKNPEAAMRYLDFWITPENFLWNWIGDYGSRYVDAKPGQMNRFGEQAKFYDVRWDEGFVDPHKDDKLDAGRLVQSPSTPWMYWEKVQAVHAEDEYSAHWWTYDSYRLANMTKLYEPFKSDSNLPKGIGSLWTTPDQATVINQIKLSITNYVNENMIRFITGDLNVDTGWDDYVKGLQNLQLESYLKILQTAYDKQVFNK